MTKKILCVFGTRPEAVKMAPVVMKLKALSPKIRTKVCVTAQHRSMLDDVLKIFRIKPDHDLDIMQDGQSLEHIGKTVLEKLAPVLKDEKPDLVLVHGDTSTTFFAALSSFYQKIPVGHVEAGLRSYDFNNPFPEEANRRLADAICALHFAPTVSAKKNLLKENISAESIFMTGNSVIDALAWAVSQKHEFNNPVLRNIFGSGQACLAPTARDENLAKAAYKLILVTAHRRENFGKPLIDIFSALRTVADRFPEVRIVYPVHLNPNVQSAVKKILSGRRNIILLPPLDYLDFSHLLKRSYMAVTDSGGLQEEAPSLGKPVLVLRKVTERPEAVAAGAAKVVGTDKNMIVREISALLEDGRAYKKMSNAVNPYGDGKASERIAKAVLFHLGLSREKPEDFKGK